MLVSTENALNLIANGEYEKAQNQLKELIALFPNENELYNLYAYCNKCIEDICENIETEDQNTVNSNTTEEHLSLWERVHPRVQENADKGNYDPAIKLLRLSATDAPINKTNYCQQRVAQPQAMLFKEIAICNFLKNDMDRAKEFYLRAIDVELSALPRNDIQRVPFLIKKKDYTEALKLLKLGTHTSYIDDRAYVYYQRYQIYKITGDNISAYKNLDEAIRYTELSIKMRPLFPNLYEQYANFLIEKGDLNNALLQNTKAIALWQGFYGYQLQRAEIYARMGKNDKALKQLSLLENGNWYRIAQYNPSEKAKVYECMGNLDIAEKYYSSENINPAIRYSNLYDFYKRNGRNNDIEKLLQEQRKEKHFQNRVSENELTALI